MGRARLTIIWLMAALVAMSACAASAGIKVYVDTSGINARTDLTATQKDEVITAMENTIKSNLEQAFGPGNVTVTHEASQAKTANRTVKTENTTGTGTDKDGKTTYHWGDWSHGSSSTTVHVGTYMDSAAGQSGSFKKPDSSWDTTKLGTAMGTTAAHEVGHSYSAGHDDTNTNKMNTANSGGQIAGGLHFNDAAKNTIKGKESQPPCSTTTNYKSACLIASWWSDPSFAPGLLLHEPLSITTSFAYGGGVASFFDIGWWGVDTDNGAVDGNPWGDFVLKSSMSGTPTDATKITFFDGWTAHFVLHGRPATPYDGQYFDVLPPNIVLSDLVVRPDGIEIARHVSLSWDVDGLPGADVLVNMDTNCYGPDSPLFSGFTTGIAPPISIQSAKKRVNGAMVSLTGKVVTAAFADHSFYIEEETRASGVRCFWPTAVPLNHRVSVIGKMSTAMNGERQIMIEELDPLGPATVGPMVMTNRAIGGSDFLYNAGLWPSGQEGIPGSRGPNNTGLSVRVFGRVLTVEPGPMPTWFLLDDGSGAVLKVLYGPDPAYPMPLTHVIVEGVSSCERLDPLDPLTRAIRATAWH